MIPNNKYDLYGVYHQQSPHLRDIKCFIYYDYLMGKQIITIFKKNKQTQAFDTIHHRLHLDDPDLLEKIKSYIDDEFYQMIQKEIFKTIC